MATIDIRQVSEDGSGPGLRIEMDRSGLEALRRSLDVIANGNHTSSTLMDGQAHCEGRKVEAVFVLVNDLKPVPKSSFNRDLAIAMAIVVVCLALVITAFVLPKNPRVHPVAPTTAAPAP